MTAKYSCNGCNEPIERVDAESGGLKRVHKDAFVTAYVGGYPEHGGDIHLCAKCAAGVLLQGVRPATDPDEMPF